MLIAGGALRTMRLVNKATSNYHLDAQHACAAPAKSASPTLLAACKTLAKAKTAAPLHAIDAASSGQCFELRTYIYYNLRANGPDYFLKLAIDQITSAAPAQKDAGGTVDE